jgi:hypothetical protein
MRKFTRADVRNWKVVNISGKTITIAGKDGNQVALTGYNGYKTALQAAKQYSGTPVRE